MHITKTFLICAAAASLLGCATVRQQDLNAWAGAPVESLDTHPVFISMPVYKTFTDSGMEIRNYTNSQKSEECFTSVGGHHGKHANYSGFMSCSENKLVCNNIFYIQDHKIVRYAPTGNCYTDDSVRPRAPILSR
jgi:hypothetical protein